MYCIKEITHEDEWELFNKKTPFTVFVQSPTYGSFYKKMKESYWIFGVYKNNILVGGSLVVSTHAKRGNFLYLPYGPLLDYADEAMCAAFFSYLRAFAKEHKYDFIRISPLIDDHRATINLLHRYDFIPAPMHVLAEQSWILDITPPEETLLKNMKKNHRNLIRRCEKEGVTVHTYTEMDTPALQRLHAMLDVTAKRLQFSRFSHTYIDTEFNSFAEKQEAVVFEAKLPDGTVDASAIIMFYGNMAVYRHSGSLHTNKHIPTPYLIQWHVIQEAKKRGVQWYNFWGVEPKHAKNHPFSGIGHFKRGFGGFQKDLVHCHDLPITYKYYLNWCVETVRKIRRGF